MITIISELDIKNARHFKRMKVGDEVVDYLRNEGFKRVGDSDSAFSVVYQKPGSNIVVKYTKKPDPCWLKFYEFAYRNQRKNEHLPRVGKIIKLDQQSDSYLYNPEKEFTEHRVVVFMEKLEEIGMRRYIKLMDYPDENPKFWELHGYLEKNIPSNCGWDLHHGNIMSRPSTGVPVIIDPYA